MPEIRTELEIAAPPERVWSVLTDFARYPEWNPFLFKVTGTPEVGGKVDVHVKARPMNTVFHCTVLIADPARHLRWRGHVLADSVVAAEHYFQLEPLEGGRTRFIHGEVFTGSLAPLAWRIIEGQTRRGYAAANAAFKGRVEAAPSPGE